MALSLSATVVAATFVFVAAPGVAAYGESMPKTARHAGIDAATEIANLFRQAPTGHRQPRPSDIPENASADPEQLDAQRLDQQIDKKLIICRGC